MQSTILTTLIDKFGLVINDNAIEELKTNAQVVEEKNETKEKIDEMLKNIKMDKEMLEKCMPWSGTIPHNLHIKFLK